MPVTSRIFSLTLVLGLLPALLAGPAHAAEDAIVTDRPDFVESSNVVGKGRFQIETSIAFETDRADGIKTRTRNTPTLLRFGVSDNLELRLETDGAQQLRTSGADTNSSQRGWTDLAIGLKWHQRDADSATGQPGLAWLIHLDVDSGAADFRGQGLRPSVRFVAEWELPHGWSAGLMPGLYVDRSTEGRRFIGGILAGVIGKSLTDELRAFVEISAQQLASARDGGQVITLDAGLAYMINPSLQLDLAVAHGLNKASPDFGWTLGLSAKF